MATTTLHQFRQQREDVVCLLRKAAALLERFSLAPDDVLEAARNLEEGRFLIVVVGEFSRGKSTFLNALLGAKVLPAHNLPTTATINEIAYGPEPVARVFYRDGTVEERPVDSLRGFALARSEEGQAEAERVRVVKIEYPCDYCRDGVVLVDTPGVNDTRPHRAEITTSYVPRADAAIMVMDTMMALSKSEKDFLTDKIVGQHIRKVFVVVNKADRVAPGELQTILARVEQELSELPGLEGRPPIYAVDSKPTLAARLEGRPASELFLRFEEDLQRFLVEEKGTWLLRNAAQRGVDRLKQFLAHCARREQAMALTLEQLQEKERRLQEVIEGIRRKQEMILNEIEASLVRAGLAQEHAVYAGVAAAADAARADLKESTESAERLSVVATKALQNHLSALLMERIAPELKREILAVVERVNAQLRTIAADMESFHAEELGLNTEAIGAAYGTVDLAVDGESSWWQWGGALGLGFWIANVLTGPFGLIAGALAALGVNSLLAGWRAGKVKEEILAKLTAAEPRLAEQVAGALQRQMEQVRRSLQEEVTRRVDRLVADNLALLEAVEREKRAEEAEQAQIRQQLAAGRAEAEALQRRLEQVAAGGMVE